MLRSHLTKPTRRLAAAALAGAVACAAVTFPAAPARAGQDCGAFTVILSDGSRFSGKQDIILPAARVTGRWATIMGRYVQFRVQMDTFTVTNYTLTGAPADTDITGGRRTVVWASRTPLLSTKLTSNIRLTINNEQLVIRRAGLGAAIKIQAKDCTQGDSFKMETGRRVTFAHQLASGFRYYVDRFGRVAFTNGTVVGREKPQLAILAAPALSAIRGATATRWLVEAGGGMEHVLGEDALQP